MGDHLASYQNRRVRAAWQWQVTWHLGMGPFNRLCDGGMKTKKKLILRDERLKVNPRTSIETPHALETPSVVAATENTGHIVRERHHVGAKAVIGEPTPDGGFTPIHHGRRRRFDVHRIRQTGDVAKARARLIGRGCTRRFGDDLTRGGERGRTCARVCVGRGETARGSARFRSLGNHRALSGTDLSGDERRARRRLLRRASRSTRRGSC